MVPENAQVRPAAPQLCRRAATGLGGTQAGRRLGGGRPAGPRRAARRRPLLELLAACITPPRRAALRLQVGLVTFGTHVHVHEIGFTECPRAYVFRGSKDYSAAQVRTGAGRGLRQDAGAFGRGLERQRQMVGCKGGIRESRPAQVAACLPCPPHAALPAARLPSPAKQVQEQLGLHSQAAQRRAGAPASPLKAGPAPGGLVQRPGNRFILPLSECEFMVTKARPARCRYCRCCCYLGSTACLGAHGVLGCLLSAEERTLIRIWKAASASAFAPAYARPGSCPPPPALGMPCNRSTPRVCVRAPADARRAAAGRVPGSGGQPASARARHGGAGAGGAAAAWSGERRRCCLRCRC